MKFTLSDGEKRRFVLLVYNFAMFDDLFSEPEKLIIESLERDIFKIEPVPKILLPTRVELIGEVDRFESLEAVKYLFKIGCGIARLNRLHSGRIKEKLEEIFRGSRYQKELDWEELCPDLKREWGKFLGSFWEKIKGQIPHFPQLPLKTGKGEENA
jgi:hypothetical protein